MKLFALSLLFTLAACVAIPVVPGSANSSAAGSAELDLERRAASRNEAIYLVHCIHPVIYGASFVVWYSDGRHKSQNYQFPNALSNLMHGDSGGYVVWEQGRSIGGARFDSGVAVTWNIDKGAQKLAVGGKAGTLQRTSLPSKEPAWTCRKDNGKKLFSWSTETQTCFKKYYCFPQE
ncbi:hypothetical protein B0T26DRAFT_756596 [Lasiosphaeria miniovina]|uniref:Uncharacterized protein n=1 Tax=Lasiosphaeria miniovina TaxID=1954250 RepID=A0AA39ZSY5_9PEZI|nr:uncharacterized protein B0T26DRAFT_756596 [Lasiosphaeria miniovina]KAK0703005.1 hypothetical protein B0T26DRAFT_756596 [Lasiosphaeria miniovina]